MTKFFTVAVVATILFSCNNAAQKGKFTVSGELKNAPDQHIYLEELYFSEKAPTVLDTADIKKGKFSLSTLSPEEGIYRLRLEKSDAPFLFINDRSDIPFSADYNNLSLASAMFNSPANQLLYKFIGTMDSQRKELEEKSAILQQYKNTPGKDSLYAVMQKDFAGKDSGFRNYIFQFLDTTGNAIVALFSLEYARASSTDMSRLEKTVNGLAKRFPGNQTVATSIAQYNQLIGQYNAQPHEGGPAPDLKMADTSGKPFALSMLRGKFVLVDFWASWCGPCRGENPNVVKAYNSYKDRNFTVLGVSLDKDRESWIKAINDDKLAWYHISDLKYWNSAAVGLYGFDGIPYNVLVNPQGKIIGSNLRGDDLEMKLAEVIK